MGNDLRSRGRRKHEHHGTNGLCAKGGRVLLRFATNLGPGLSDPAVASRCGANSTGHTMAEDMVDGWAIEPMVERRTRSCGLFQRADRIHGSISQNRTVSR